MYDNDLAYQILKILKKKEDGLTINEMSKILQIKKHKYKDLVSTAKQLHKEQKLFYSDKKYQIRKSKPRINKSIKTIIGIFDATSLVKNNSFAFVITDRGDIFVSSEDTMNAFHGDKVVVEIYRSNDRMTYGRIVRILERSRDIFVGNIYKYHGQAFLKADNSKIHKDFEIINADNCSEGYKGVLKITNWGNVELGKPPIGEIIEILGKSGNPEVEIMATIRYYDLPLTFPDNVLEEVKKVSPVISAEEISRRSDFRNLTTFTIDPISAKDYDDAISYEKTDFGWKLYVHIADVAHYAKINSLIFNEAYKRGNSYYFPKKVIPMLPEKLSNKVCSLRPNEDKLTMSVVTFFNTNFKILKQEVVEAVICSDARLNYQQVDDLFNGEETEIPENIIEVIHNLKKLSNHLQNKRISKGYLSFNLPESEFIFNENGKIIDIKRSRETESHQLVENCMLVANEFVAKILLKKSDSTMYRIHEEPEAKDLSKLKDILSNYQIQLEYKKNNNYTLQNVMKQLNYFPNYHRVFDFIILRKMKRAKYSVIHKGHFGLALQTYTHFTSPIRRLCDLIIHHQLKKIVIYKKSNPFSYSKIADYAKQATNKELIATQSEREINKKNEIFFIKNFIGEDFSGIVRSMNSSNLFVELDRYPIIGNVPLSSLRGGKYSFDSNLMQISSSKSDFIIKLTQEVKVKIVKVSDEVELELIEIIEKPSK